MGNKKDILVSCICITYNHKDFINKCLDGMLMQETDFPYEIIIYDDCSTDGTREIVKEYAEKYPNKIRTVLPEENQYSKIGDIVREVFVHPIVKGKYVALCEGDDFWNDPLKLQLQANFMEKHPEYSVCYHECLIYNTVTRELYPTTKYSIDGDFDITTDMFLNSSERLGQPLTMMYRLNRWSADWMKHYTRYCDSMENYHFLRAGKGRLLRFIGGQYNLQPSGVSAFYSNIKRSWDDCEDYQQMWDYTHDSVVLQKCLSAYLWRLQVCKENNMIKEYWKTTFYALAHNPKIGLIVLKKAIIRRLKK